METIGTLLGEIFNWPLGTAKCVLILICICASLLSLYVSLNYRTWFTELEQLEQTCDIMRDEAMIGAATIRSELAMIRARMRSLTENRTNESPQDLLVKAKPLLWLMLKKERSFAKWLPVVFRLGMTGFNFIQGKRKN